MGAEDDAEEEMRHQRLADKMLEGAEEMQVLMDLARDKWCLLWADDRLNEAALRLVKAHLVQRINDDKGGPPGRFELWPVVQNRIIRAGACREMIDLVVRRAGEKK